MGESTKSELGLQAHYWPTIGDQIASQPQIGRRVPIMMLSDSVTAKTGLGRIARELATHIARDLDHVFDIATFGFGGNIDYSLPFHQYPMTKLENYIPSELPEVWNNHAQGRGGGILLAIWNPGWLPWLADPAANLPADHPLRVFLETKPFRRYLYPAIDGYGPQGKLPQSLLDLIGGFDRVAHYSQFAARLVGDGNPNLPHGLDRSVFYPRDRQEARRTLISRVLGEDILVPESMLLLGICATNSARKDWNLAFEVAAEMLKRYPNQVGVWGHTDFTQKYWDLPELVKQHGLSGRVMLSTRQLSDEDMAQTYSACDVTLGIAPEGWGYPLAESLACGVPVIHMPYAGGAEFTPKELQVEPVGFRGEGIYAMQRPVFRASDWADKAEMAIGMKVAGEKFDIPSYVDWDNAWPCWREWLCADLEGRR